MELHGQGRCGAPLPVRANRTDESAASGLAGRLESSTGDCRRIAPTCGGLPAWVTGEPLSGRGKDSPALFHVKRVLRSFATVRDKHLPAADIAFLALQRVSATLWRGTERTGRANANGGRCERRWQAVSDSAEAAPQAKRGLYTRYSATYPARQGRLRAACEPVTVRLPRSAFSNARQAEIHGEEFHVKQAANGQTDQREMYDPCAGERAPQVRPTVVMPPGARLVGARTYGEPAPQSSAAPRFT